MYNMAKSVCALVDVVTVFVVVFVVALVITDVILLIGVAAAVVVVTLITAGWLFKVAIVTIPAMHVATSIKNQTSIL